MKVLTLEQLQMMKKKAKGIVLMGKQLKCNETVLLRDPVPFNTRFITDLISSFLENSEFSMLLLMNEHQICLNSANERVLVKECFSASEFDSYVNSLEWDPKIQLVLVDNLDAFEYERQYRKMCLEPSSLTEVACRLDCIVFARQHRF